MTLCRQERSCWGGRFWRWSKDSGTGWSLWQHTFSPSLLWVVTESPVWVASKAIKGLFHSPVLDLDRSCMEDNATLCSLTDKISLWDRLRRNWVVFRVGFACGLRVNSNWISWTRGRSFTIEHIWLYQALPLPPVCSFKEFVSTRPASASIQDTLPTRLPRLELNPLPSGWALASWLSTDVLDKKCLLNWPPMVSGLCLCEKCSKRVKLGTKAAPPPVVECLLCIWDSSANKLPSEPTTGCQRYCCSTSRNPEVPLWHSWSTLVSQSPPFTPVFSPSGSLSVTSADWASVSDLWGAECCFSHWMSRLVWSDFPRLLVSPAGLLVAQCSISALGVSGTCWDSEGPLKLLSVLFCGNSKSVEARDVENICKEKKGIVSREFSY